MKRILKVMSLLALVAVLAMALVACGGGGDSEGECKVVIASSPETVYTVDLSELEITEGVYSVLKYLKENEGLEFSATESAATGAYLNTVEGIELQSSQYIWVWTSVEADFDTSGFVSDVEYGGVTLKSSANGISSMSVPDGAIIYISFIEY